MTDPGLGGGREEIPGRGNNMHSDPKAAMPRDIQVTARGRRSLGVGQVRWSRWEKGKDPSSREDKQCKSLEG